MELFMVRPWKIHDRVILSLKWTVGTFPSMSCLSPSLHGQHVIFLCLSHPSGMSVGICLLENSIFIIFNFLQTVEWKILPQTTFKSYLKGRPYNSWTHKPQMKIRKKGTLCTSFKRKMKHQFFYVRISGRWQEIQGRISEGTESLTGLFFHKERQIG